MRRPMDRPDKGFAAQNGCALNLLSVLPPGGDFRLVMAESSHKEVDKSKKPVILRSKDGKTTGLRID